MIPMTRPARAALLAATLALAACRPDLTGLQILDIEQLVAWRSASQDFALYDANNDDTRRKRGVIPGAVLLSSYRDYDPAAELPADAARRLVFYCYSPMCSAASDAARRAQEAGHADVWVMEAGIQGWLEAGHAVDRAAGTELGAELGS